MSVKLSTRQVGNVSVIDVAGRITLGEGSSALRETLRDMVAKNQNKILLNLADVTYIENEAPRQRVLDRSVPRFHIRVFEVLINHEVVHRYRRIGNDPVRGNNGENRSGKAILKSRRLPIRKHCRTKARNCWIEGVISAYGEIIGVAVVGERRIADPEASAKDCRFL